MKHHTTERVLEFICQFIQQHGWPPTVREIERGMGFHSTSVVQYHLFKLVDSGRIERGEGARTIRVTPGGEPNAELRNGRTGS